MPKPTSNALHFNGSEDAIFIDENPIKGLNSFTVEVYFKPETKGAKAQRFLHLGSIDDDRLLFETRLTDDGQWYLDTYIKSGDSDCVLKSAKFLHPLNEWYHLALVVENGKMKNYVNGTLELEGIVNNFKPISDGQTSIGVRQNKVHWFKGEIGWVKVSPKALEVHQFKTH